MDSPTQHELALPFPELTGNQPLPPTRMINEYVYCPRLAYLEQVQGEWADSRATRSWVRDKNMQVLQFLSDGHRETPIDVFVTEPFSFDEEYRQSLVKPLYGSIEVRFVSIPTLIRMKQAAGRPEDLIDIHHLQMRRDEDT
jgi:hypothetical protein